MAEYLVLARKYRPATFQEVVGQEHIASTLTGAINAERVAHAFLFAGTRGVGKTTVARILAKALNCLSSDAPTITPCNRCDACVAIARGDDVDVMEIDGASNRGIDEIRDLRSNAIYRPSRCRYKVYYIDEVHALTRDAFNALLKTLEEPPPHVKFIFATTAPEKLPATIISRCQRYDFRDLSTRLIAEHLRRVCQAEKVQVEDGAIFRVARAARGSMRDGLSLLDQLLGAGAGSVAEDDVVRLLGTPPDEQTDAIVTAIVNGEPAAALDGLDALVASGITLESAITAIAETFRNMMLAQACGPASPLIELPEAQRQRVAELAGRMSLPSLVQSVSLCQTTVRNLRGLTSGRGLVEAALVRLAAREKFVDAGSLIERLERLSGQGATGQRSGPSGMAPAAPVPPARGEKKKPGSVPAAEPAEPIPRPPAPPGRPPVAQGALGQATTGQAPTGSAPPTEKPQWEGQYLRQHWDRVVTALGQDRAGQVGGLLAPAKVLTVEGNRLRLGYDAPHEGIRRRCVERMDVQIRSALGRLFERQVECEYVPMGERREGPVRAANAAISTAERAEVANDPAVRPVLDFFDGSISDIRRQPAAQPEADHPPEQQ